MKDYEMIPKPSVGPFEFNLNTLVVLVGFASGFVAWGYTLAEMQTGIGKIERVEVRVTQNETSLRRVDNLEYRVGAIEQKASESSQAMRELEVTLNSLAADMRVMREIMERLEARQRVDRAPP